MDYDVLIIGGGASGLIASIFAAQNLKNGKVAIVERNNRVGKKILSTGNGRCNFTNSDIDISRYYSSDIKFAGNVLNSFNKDKTLAFFKEIGVLPKIEKDGKIFPNSLQASSVLDLLRLKAKKSGVTEIVSFECVKISKAGNCFEVFSYSGEKLTAKCVIVSTGGKAQPKSGSDGNGYKLLTSLGHSMTRILPALVQVKCPAKTTSPMKGAKLDVNATLFVNGKKVKCDFGELLFTDYGLSGPVIFNLSRYVSIAVADNQKVEVKIDFIPSMTEKDLLSYLLNRERNITAEDFLNGMINKLIGKQLMKRAGFEKLNLNVCDFDESYLIKLSEIMKNCKFEIIGTNSWDNAQVTAGGIMLKNFNSKTMESELIKGLFACGEILDVDGDCGGFNLQWAWSSGYLAGVSAALSAKGI